MAENIDIAVFQTDSDGRYKIDIDPNTGDFLQTKGLDTSITNSLFLDKRARSSQVADEQKRRGWFGSLFNRILGYSEGSHIWLNYQERNTQETLNKNIAFAKEALQWTINFDYFDRVEVTGDRTLTEQNLLVQGFKNGSLVFSKNYTIIINTGDYL